MKEGKVIFILGLILAALGLLMTVAFIWSVLGVRKKVIGTVKSVKVKKSTLRGSTIKRYVPVFSYAFGGKEYQITWDRETGNEKKFHVGDEVTLRVNEKHPEEARYGVNVGMLVLGVIFAVAGAMMIIVAVG